MRNPVRGVGLALACGALALATALHLPANAQTTAPQIAAVQPTGGPVVLAPHRAVYEIALDQARGGSGVSDMSGRMVYELTGSACDGYTQNMRFVTRMTNQEGISSLTDMRSSSWEDALGKAFRFNSSQYKDAKLSETTLGDAARSEVASEGKVELTKPAKKDVRLKRNVYFPIQHSIALLAAARSGQTLFEADLYDGSEKGEKTYATTSYIGAMRPVGYNSKLPQVANAERLNTLKSWPVSISYFEGATDKIDSIPVYELAFLYFENGVSRRLYIDYGDFSIRGTLKDITFFEPTKCSDKKPSLPGK
jgi:hypothetical protein